MAKITEEMKALIKEQQAFIATASPDGTPNIAPKGSTRVLDEEHITFAESAGKRTYENLKKNPKVSIVVCDRAQMKCLRFQGKAEILTSGPLFEKSVEHEKDGRAPTPGIDQGQGGGNLRPGHARIRQKDSLNCTDKACCALTRFHLRAIGECGVAVRLRRTPNPSEEGGGFRGLTRS